MRLYKSFVKALFESLKVSQVELKTRLGNLEDVRSTFIRHISALRALHFFHFSNGDFSARDMKTF